MSALTAFSSECDRCDCSQHAAVPVILDDQTFQFSFVPGFVHVVVATWVAALCMLCMQAQLVQQSCQLNQKSHQKGRYHAARTYADDHDIIRRQLWQHSGMHDTLCDTTRLQQLASRSLYDLISSLD